MEDFLFTDGEICVHQYLMPGIHSGMYIIIEQKDTLVIDPNCREDAMNLLGRNQVTNVVALLTHEHFDHISGVNLLREHFSTHVICSTAAAERITDPNKNLAKYWEVTMRDQPKDKWAEWEKEKDEDYSCTADEIFDGEKSWNWHGHQIHAVLAPGHSPGSVIYFIDDLLFSGDSLINGNGVICRLPGGSWRTYAEKTRPLIESLPDSTPVFPGHEKPAQLGILRKYLNKFGRVQE